MSSRASWVSVALVALLAVAFAPSCTQGEGTGAASGTLDVFDCWTGSFNLHPDFFAAVPSSPGDAMQIRIQNGGDYETFSDGIAFLVDDAGEIRGDPASDGSPRPSLLGQTLVVGLPAGVTPPGVPVQAVANPSIVHASLYLNASCRTQNVALYAMSAVSLSDGASCEESQGGEALPCGAPAIVGSDAEVVTDADLDGTLAANTNASEGGAALATEPGRGEAGPSSPTGTSTIVFSSLFDGNPAETDAQQRLSDAQFDLYFADPREVCPGGIGPPPRCRGHLTGYFRFYFENGQPAQPFP
ncbi:MAG: hypothetical protein ABSF69_04820 [Polyangiaceae bacterium]